MSNLRGKQADSILKFEDVPSEQEVFTVEHCDPSDQNHTLIEWTLGNTCNFSCSYCPSNLHDGSLAWLDLERLYNFIDALTAHYVEDLGREIWLQYSGGEPTLYPHFLELIEAADRKKIKQSVISNGSRSLKFWSQASAFLTNVHLTFHHEKASKKHFLEVIDCISENCSVHVNFPMDPKCFDELYGLALQTRKKFPNLTITLKPLRRDFGKVLYDYTQEQIELMKKRMPPLEYNKTFCRSVMVLKDQKNKKYQMKANTIILNQLNQWEGWDCAIGVEQLMVMSNGAIFRGMCRVGGAIGNISDAKFNFPSEGIICNTEKCRCVTDILTTKKRHV